VINRQAGQTIMEVLIALSAAVIILSAITALVLSSLNQATSSSSLGAATHYAQQGMELSLAKGGFRSGDTFCLRSDNLFQRGPCSSTNRDTYRRVVTATGNACANSTKMKIIVTVSWDDAKCQNQPYCHSIPLTSCI
jgi:hypothetical protein